MFAKNDFLPGDSGEASVFFGGVDTALVSVLVSAFDSCGAAAGYCDVVAWSIFPSGLCFLFSAAEGCPCALVGV